MKISVTTVSPNVLQQVPISLFSGTFEERLEKIANSSFEGIELLPLNPLELDAEQIVASVRKNKLSMAAIGTGIQASIGKLTLISNDNFVEDRALTRMKNLIDFANQCNSPIVTLGSFRGKLNPKDSTETTRFDRIMEKIADYALQKSVSIAIEPLNRYENSFLNVGTEVVGLINRIGAPNIGLLLDSFHMNIEESSIEKTIELTGPYIFHVHIGDSNRLPPGKGHFNFKSMLRALQIVGYDKWLSAELFAKPDADTAGAETGKYLRELVDSKIN